MTRVGSWSLTQISCFNDVVRHRHLSIIFPHLIQRAEDACTHNSHPSRFLRQRIVSVCKKENGTVLVKSKALLINQIQVLCKNFHEKDLFALNYCQLRYYSSDIKNSKNFLPGKESKSAICEGTRTEVKENLDKSEQASYTDVTENLDKSDQASDTDVTENLDKSGQASDTDDEEDPGFKAVLSAITPNIPPPSVVEFVPGKGPPPAPPVDCCMSGCANCVWIQYAEELKNYFSVEEGNQRAREAIDRIDNPGLQMFLKLELGLL